LDGTALSLDAFDDVRVSVRHHMKLTRGEKLGQ
jgi:hypothetical protein